MRLVLFSLIGLLISCGENLSSQMEGSLEEASMELSSESVTIGDMVLEKTDYEHYFEEHDEDEAGFANDSELSTQGAAYHGIRLWPNGVLPISFDSRFSTKERQNFMKYCEDWGKQSRVKCINRSNQKAYVYVTKSKNGNSSACYAEVGYQNKRRMMWLPGNCAVSKRSILHELGHIIGLMHEHQRPDRDNYLRVQWSNVHSSYRSAFTKKSRAHSKKTSFDFDSVMMYSSWAFSTNRQATLVKYNNNKDTWGIKSELSTNDLRVAGMLYPKPSSGGGSGGGSGPGRSYPSPRNCRFYRGTFVCYNLP